MKIRQRYIIVFFWLLVVVVQPETSLPDELDFRNIFLKSKKYF